MELVEKKNGEVVTLAISGKMDAITTPEFNTWFDGKVSAGETRFVVDCGNLSYLSSAGLRGFMIVAKQIKAIQGRLILCGLAGVALEVFRVSGFLTIYETYSSLEDALSALKG